ncbi:MAG: hypothetical protein ACI8QC_002179 [Planctomycetota bacterium]|jgi:hypothetical protein
MLRPLPLVLSLILAASGATSAPAQQWRIENLSVARQSFATVAIDNLVLFAGGRVGNAIMDDVDIYDTTTCQWAKIYLPVPRTNLSATTVGQYVLFAGGFQSGFVVSNVVDILDTVTMNWTQVNLSQARASVGMTTVGNKVLVAGGAGQGWVSNRVDVYDATLGPPDNQAAWSIGTPLSLMRSHTSAVTVGHHAIFAGGAGVGGTPFADVDIYDCLNNVWMQDMLSVARVLGNGATVVGNRAYFAGGHFSQGGGPNMSDALDVYDVPGGFLPATVLPSGPRGYLGVTAMGDMVLLAGGVNTGFVKSNLIETLNVCTGQWGFLQNLSQPGSSDATVCADMAFFADNGTTVVEVYEALGTSFCDAVANSSGNPATISVSGSSSVAANDLTLTACQLPPNQFGYFLNSTTPGFIPNPGGSQGNLCLGGAIGRYTQNVFGSGAAGTGSLLLDLPNTPTPTGSVAILAGSTWSFQCWYRDINPGPTSNFTDAVTVTFQ